MGVYGIDSMGISYDETRQAWIVDDVSVAIPRFWNNMLKHGQPYAPTDPLFRSDISSAYEGIMSFGQFNKNELQFTSPKVIFNNQDVMFNGFGDNIRFSDFDIVKNFNNGNISGLGDKTYSLSDLQALGVSKTGRFGDHALNASLYLFSENVSAGFNQDANGPFLAYGFGSVRFQLAADTKFTIQNGQLISVEGKLELQSDNFNHESGDLDSLISKLVKAFAGDEQNFSEVLIEFEGTGVERRFRKIIHPDGSVEIVEEKEEETKPCFLAGTEIDLGGDTWKLIEDIQIGDEVACYDQHDGLSELATGTVTSIQRNTAQYILNFHGLMVTPGHVTLCGDGAFAGRHVPIIDILRSDGAVVDRDGKLIRAATNAQVGSDEDRFVEVCAIGPTSTDIDAMDGVHEAGRVRAGTRILLDDGNSFSLLDKIIEAGGGILDDGRVRIGADGTPGPFLMWLDRLPRPEDYVLARSEVSLMDIYEAGEWEATVSAMPPPGSQELGSPDGATRPAAQFAAGDTSNGETQPSDRSVQRRYRGEDLH